MPIGVQRIIPDAVGIKMVKAVPAPDHFALWRELDNHVPDYFAVSLVLVGFTGRCRPVLHALCVCRERKEVAARHLVGLMMQAANVDWNAAFLGALRSSRGVPGSDDVPGNVDLSRTGFRVMDKQVAACQMLDARRTSVELPHPAHPALVVDRDQHAPVGEPLALGRRHVRDAPHGAAANGEESESTRHAMRLGDACLQRRHFERRGRDIIQPVCDRLRPCHGAVLPGDLHRCFRNAFRMEPKQQVATVRGWEGDRPGIAVLLDPDTNLVCTRRLHAQPGDKWRMRRSVFDDRFCKELWCRH